MKKVIFIGSNSYSGSTFFSMVLSNAPNGFCCGEVINFLNPTRPFHPNYICSCGDKNCKIWSQIKRKNQNNFYETIFNMLPNVDYIVDSSKDPFWICSQIDNLSRKGIETKNILMWKTPLEIAHSYKKRNKLSLWHKSWIAYHRLYYSTINDWRCVKYSQYIRDDTVLKKVCNYLGIPFFRGKDRYWEKDQHIIGGNHSARIHLYDNNSINYLNSISKIPAQEKNTLANEDKTKKTHRTIYNEKINDESLNKNIEYYINNSKYITKILEMLNSFDVTNESVNPSVWPLLQIPKPLLELRKIKRALQFQIGRYRYL